MQLRTNRKVKSPDLDDLVYENHYVKARKKSHSTKLSVEKDHSNGDVSDIFLI